MIVVRPTSKRQKKKRKRQADPSRQHYLDILTKSEANSGHIVSNRSSITEGTQVAPEVEAEAVAEAIGLPANYTPSVDPLALSKVHSTRRNVTLPETVSPTDDASSDDLRSPGVVMQSPSLGKLDSPAASESEPSDDEDEGQGEEGNITTIKTTNTEEIEIVQDDENSKATEG